MEARHVHAPIPDCYGVFTGLVASWSLLVVSYKLKLSFNTGWIIFVFSSVGLVF